jgi:glycosyltransferase involved in cell wall biosynthesis
MKILVVAPSAYLLGGVQDWLHMLILGLRKRGYNINIAVPNNHFHNGNKYSQYYSDIDPIFFTDQTGTISGRISALSCLLINYQADIIVGVNIGDLYLAYATSYQYLNKSRLTMTIHAIEGDYFGDIGRYNSLLDGVITTNKLTQKMVKSLNLIEDAKVLYCPYGVESNINHTSILKPQNLRIAWVGRFENQQKRILDLYDILTSLEDYDISFTLSIAGDGPLKNKIQNDLKKWIKVGKVNIVGFLRKDQLKSFYASNDILLITSEWETGPIVAWEAMLSGLVIVSSQYVGISSENALIHEETALLYPIGAGKLAAQQVSRLEDIHLFQRLVNNGRSMATFRYTQQVSLDNWEQAFLKIAQSKSNIKTIPNFPTQKANGKIEMLIGNEAGKVIRRCIGKRGFCRDPGSEWPHSTYGYSNLNSLLEYAKLLEQTP